MKIIESKSELDKISRGQVLSIGNFDGLHLGHQQIIEAAKRIARKRRTTFAVMTFSPHPVAILQPQKCPGVLMPLPLKKYLLQALGVETLIVLKDSPELLSLSPEAFIDQFLMKNVQPCVVVEGENFHFGCARAGNIQTLQQLGAERGFEVLVVPAERIELRLGQNTIVSSTLVRNLLQEGHVQQAAGALGRPYRLVGRVVPGYGRGAKLGFPTANIELSNQIIPAEGVYAGFAAVADTCRQLCKTEAKSPAALSLGGAKTFGTEQALTVEAHILSDKVSNLYGKWLAMDFVERIRSQQRFETQVELSAQIAKDCEKTKRILAKQSQ